MEKAVKLTFLKALFAEPDPLPDKAQVYELLFDRIFPDKDNFIKFLRTNDASEQLKTAKILLQRICFESNFPPAYDLLINLLNFEVSDKNQSTSNAYIPQDHFVHKLNSYIFGIYLFFYHPLLSKKMTAHFMGVRNTERTINPVLSASKDFISFWKYFCLFHDIAYPIESTYFCTRDEKGEKGKPEIKEDYKQFVEKFDNIYLLSFREWISTALARYIAVCDLLFDPENKKFDKIFLDKKANFCCNDIKKSYDELCEIFANYVCVDKLFSYEHYKMFTGFVEEKDFLFVLMDNYTGNPIAFKECNGDSVNYYRIEQYFDDLSSLDIKYFLDSEEYQPSDRFQVRYFLKDCHSQFKKINIRFGQEQITEQNIRSIKRAIKKKVKNKDDLQELSRFDRITDASELDDYIFIFYRSIYSFTCGLFTDNEDLKSPIEIADFKLMANKKIYYQMYKENFHKIIKQSAEEQIEESLTSVDKIIFKAIEKNELSSTKVGEQRLASISKKLKDSVSGFNWGRICNEAFDNLDSLIGSEQNDIDLLLTVLLSFAMQIMPGDPQNNAFDKFIIDKVLKCTIFENNALDKDVAIDYIKSLPDSTCKAFNIIDSIQSALKNIVCNDEICYDTFAKGYYTDYCELDHGIWGAQIYILNMCISQTVLEKMFSNKNDLGKSICTLIWNVSKDKFSSKLVENYSTISRDVAKAIFTHNIYPRNFEKIDQLKNNKWMVNINSEPCCYFAMLVDALQLWQRRKYNSAIIDPELLFEADSYNIMIKNKKLCISFKCPTYNIESLYNKIVRSFDEYLSDASSVFTISIEGY